MKCAKCGYISPKIHEDMAIFEEVGNNGGKANTHLLGIVQVNLCNLCAQKLYENGLELKKEEKPLYIAILAVVFALIVYFMIAWETGTSLIVTIALFGAVILISNIRNTLQQNNRKKQKTEAFTKAKASGFNGKVSLTAFIDTFDDVALKTLLNAKKLEALLKANATKEEILESDILSTPINRKQGVYVNRRLGYVKPTSSYIYVPISELETAHVRLTGETISPAVPEIYQALKAKGSNLLEKSMQ